MMTYKLKYMLLKNKLLTIGIAVSLALIGNGCDKYWDEHYHTSDETTEKEKVIAEMEKIPEISSFTAAVKNVEELTDLLGQNRLFTVFAPKNETFDAIDPSIKNNEELYQRMLLYHFIDGKFKNKDFTSSEQLTFNGKYLNISLADTLGNILLDNAAKIVGTDYLALNGMIQVIDEPLLPLNNLYEYFLYNDYMVKFAEAIDSYTTLEWDLGASTPESINEAGEIVYDSAFNIINPFLYTQEEWRHEIFYYTDLRFINISDEESKYTCIIPDNFNTAIDAAKSSPFLNDNSALSSEDMAGPLLANGIISMELSKDEAISYIEERHAAQDADTSEVQLYLLELLKNNYKSAVNISNGVVHEVSSFNYDLGWLIKDQVQRAEGERETDYLDALMESISISEGVDTVNRNPTNIRIDFYNVPTDPTGYSTKYGEWASIELSGEFYPVDYKVYIKGRNTASGKFRIEMEGQVVGEYNFSTMPSGDLETVFDEIGNVSFATSKTKSTIKFTFIETHDSFNTGQQYLWIRELKLVPILD